MYGIFIQYIKIAIMLGTFIFFVNKLSLIVKPQFLGADVNILICYLFIIQLLCLKLFINMILNLNKYA